MGISIPAPDVNKSGLKFIQGNVEGPSAPDNRDTKAAPAFNASVTALPRSNTSAKARWTPPFASANSEAIFDRWKIFCSRLDSRVANRKMLESLIKAGAFDFLGRDRAELFA
jgi:DNA polymerase-3 subunit alpha